jgi:hypothetical protein
VKEEIPLNLFRLPLTPEKINPSTFSEHLDSVKAAIKMSELAKMEHSEFHYFNRFVCPVPCPRPRLIAVILVTITTVKKNAPMIYRQIMLTALVPHRHP